MRTKLTLISATAMVAVLTLITCSCKSPGKARISFPKGPTIAVAQNQNPEEATIVTHETFPSANFATQPEPAQKADPSLVSSGQAQGNVARGVQEQSQSWTPIQSRTVVSLGRIREDKAAFEKAKLSSMKPITWLGTALLLAAIAMFHPLVFAATQSRTLQAVCFATGMALLFLPSVIVGHETLLIACGIAVPLVWFVAHRHGELKSAVSRQWSVGSGAGSKDVKDTKDAKSGPLARWRSPSGTSIANSQ